MTDYSTDFSEYTTDEQPSDWTERWNTGDATALVKEEVGAEGGKFLRIDHSSDDQYALSWDDVGDVADVEILGRVRWSDALVSVMRLYIRGSGAAGSENSYHVSINSVNHLIQLYKYDNGAATELDSAGLAVAQDEWIYIRLRAEGTAIKAKIWAIDEESEPTDWTFEKTDSAVATGWVGIGPFRGDFGDCDWFGVATGGDTVVNSVGQDDPQYYYTDFSEYTTDEQPSDWTERWNPSVGTAIVLEEVAAIGGKHLNIDHSSNNRYYLSWDDLGVVSDIDILARVRVAGTGPSIIQLIARAYTSSEETGYAISADSDDERFLIKRYFGGTGIDIATAYDYAFVVDTWHMIRFRLEGTAIKFRVWADGGEEPEVWHKDITDVRIINGFCGIGSYRENDADCDWISIATAGGIAPGPPIGWTGKINTVTNPAKINPNAVADIAKVCGIS